MADPNLVTCSFSMDRQTYNEFKSIVVRHGENVKGNIIKYMMNVIASNTPNPETIEALEEVKAMKKNPSLGKSYHDANAMMRDILG